MFPEQEPGEAPGCVLPEPEPKRVEKAGEAEQVVVVGGVELPTAVAAALAEQEAKRVG